MDDKVLEFRDLAVGDVIWKFSTTELIVCSGIVQEIEEDTDMGILEVTVNFEALQLNLGLDMISLGEHKKSKTLVRVEKNSYDKSIVTICTTLKECREALDNYIRTSLNIVENDIKRLRESNPLLVHD